MHLEQQISEWLGEQLSGQDIFLTELKMGAGKVLVTLDGDQLVEVKRCVELSRALSNFIEENNLIEGAFLLEVGSPGADSPLKLSRQYPKHIGRKFSVKLQGGDKIEGVLISSDETGILVSVPKKEKGKKAILEEIPFLFSEIAEAKIVIDFKGKD